MKLIEGLKNEITEILETLFHEEVPFRTGMKRWSERGGKEGERKREREKRKKVKLREREQNQDLEQRKETERF